MCHEIRLVMLIVKIRKFEITTKWKLTSDILKLKFSAVAGNAFSLQQPRPHQYFLLFSSSSLSIPILSTSPFHAFSFPSVHFSFNFLPFTVSSFPLLYLPSLYCIFLSLTVTSFPLLCILSSPQLLLGKDSIKKDRV